MARATRGKPGERVDKVRAKRVALNLAKGMSAEKAVLSAGYSQNYAKSEAYKVVKRPYIQSIFTDAVERLLDKYEMKLDDILSPYFEGLKAKVIVKSTQLGDAQEVDLPDHTIRMEAAGHLAKLLGAEAKLAEEEDRKGDDHSVTINYYTLTEEEHEKLTAGGVIDVTPTASPGLDSGGSGGDGTLVPQDGTKP